MPFNPQPPPQSIDLKKPKKEDFETPFLESTRLFYRGESQNFIARNTCPDYMVKVRVFVLICVYVYLYVRTNICHQSFVYLYVQIT